ncbi:MAG TPA: LETM1 domain-containing protein [Fredinandcohnia sp.]|nr:LETM1 domain-containing protein [Fredinandcohnia sp.]
MEQTRIKKWVDRIVHEISVNAGRVSQEVRETGELASLLSKAAAGQKLTEEERAKVREQLIDLAKIVPSLAILAAPGGTLILAALLKILPFSLLPSAFQTKPEDAAAAEGGADGTEGGRPPEAADAAPDPKTGTDEG